MSSSPTLQPCSGYHSSYKNLQQQNASLDYISYYLAPLFTSAKGFKPQDEFMIDEKMGVVPGSPAFDDIFSSIYDLEDVGYANSPSPASVPLISEDNHSPQCMPSSPFDSTHEDREPSSPYAGPNSFPHYIESMAPMNDGLYVYPSALMYTPLPYTPNLRDSSASPSAEGPMICHTNEPYQPNHFHGGDAQLYAQAFMFHEQQFEVPHPSSHSHGHGHGHGHSHSHSHSHGHGHSALTPAHDPHPHGSQPDRADTGLWIHEQWSIDAPPPDPPKQKRVGRACLHCHNIKRKCSESLPCERCMEEGIECIRK